MRVESATNGSISYYIAKTKRALSLETLDYLKNYDSDNFKYINQEMQKDDEPAKLLDHQSIFSFNSNEKDYVSILYEDTDSLMSELEDMIFASSSTYHLRDSYKKLKSKEMINFGTHNENSYGFISYNKNDVQDSEIFITTNQSIVGVATTLVHELQHHHDLNRVSKQQNQQIDTFTLELNAFAKEYQFLNNTNYIYDESYTSLGKLAKDIYINAKEFKEKNITELNKIEFFSSLLEQIGYDKKEQFKKEFISSKDIELSKIITVSNGLDRMVFDSLVKNNL